MEKFPSTESNEELRNPTVEIPPHIPKKSPAEIARILGLSFALAVAPEKTSEDTEVITEEQEVIAKVIGTELAEEFMENGFIISVPVLAEEGDPYIIHIGQIHDLPHIDFMNAQTVREMVADFQPRLYELVPKLQDNQSEPLTVFKEGYVEDPTDIKNFVQHLESEMLPVAPETIQDLETAWRLAHWVGQYHRYNHGLVERYFRYSELTREHVDALHQTVMRVLQEANIDDENVQTQIKQRLEELRAYEEIGSVYRFSTMFYTYTYNAIDHLYMNGLVEIEPVETIEANGGAMEAIREMRELEHEFSIRYDEAYSEEALRISRELSSLVKKKQEGSLSPEEESLYDSLVQERDELVDTILTDLHNSDFGKMYLAAEAYRDEKVYTIREEAALEIIGDVVFSQNTLPQKIVVVYGDNHDFGAEVEAYNNTSDAGDFGLIKIGISDHYIRSTFGDEVADALDR